MTLPRKDPDRRCLKVNDWPEADQTAWHRILENDHILGDPGLGSHWSKDTRHKHRRGYGRWLNHIIRNAGPSLPKGPGDRVTRKAIGEYLNELISQGLAPFTMVARIEEVRAVVSAMAPQYDWQWLTDLVTRLRLRARPVVNKRERIVPITDLFRLGLSLMTDAASNPEMKNLSQSIQFRDGLMIALLAARPLRRSNFTSIAINRHLIKVADEYHLVFEAHETKTRKPLEFPFPELLLSHLEKYLTEYRPRLLNSCQCNELWISNRGTPLSAHTVCLRVRQLTQDAFGIPINPHLFRDCAATSAAIEAPEQVKIVSSILGHSDPRTTERHYNQAKTLEAGRLYQNGIALCRKILRAEYGRTQR